MKKFTVITSMTIFLASGAAVATETNKAPNMYEDLAQVCEYFPQECMVSPDGAGNGGGNEPPYTPRKPKKRK